MKLIKLIFSFEFAFVAFLFAGQYKADPRLTFFPIDLTLLFFLISTSLGGLILLKKFHIPTKAISYISIFFIFCMYMLLSTSWSPSTLYAKEKTLKIIALVGWSFLAPLLLIGTSNNRRERFKTSILLIAGWMSVEAALLSASGASGFLKVMGSNYLGLGRILGLGFIVALSRLKKSNYKHGKRAFYLCLMTLFLFFMLKGGGRGPLVALLGGWFFVSLLDFNFSTLVSRLRISRRVFLKGVVVLFIVVTVVSNFECLANTSRTFARIKVLISSEDYGSSGNARVMHWKNAFALWMENPVVGYGIGSWPMLNSTEDHRSYPHNIILEILVEMGLIGLFLFILLIFDALKAAKNASKTGIANDVFFLQMILLFSLLNAMVSGDIPDNRFLFTAIGLCASGVYCIRRGLSPTGS